MSEDLRQHWDSAYGQGEATRSWFQDVATPSLDAIAATGVDASAGVVDIGGGASRLVDGLLARGWSDVTVVDVSGTALDVARGRLAERAREVTWVCRDLLAWRPERRYAVWHDRAVLHFLTESDEQAAYAALLERATDVGGWAILATFAPDGPQFCSGLPVARHDAESLAALVGPRWRLVFTHREAHNTPAGAEQAFVWATFERLS